MLNYVQSFLLHVLDTKPTSLGTRRALYEQMFRAEPRKHVSRPTFLTVMRRVYGFQTAPLAGHVDKAALQKLGEVCSISVRWHTPGFSE